VRSGQGHDAAVVRRHRRVPVRRRNQRDAGRAAPRLGSAAERLENFIAKAAQATLVGDVFDDAATGQGLLNYFLRALNCGAIDLSDIEQTGLTAAEVELRSFAKILAARRARLGGHAATS
jgi:hypothetical protein